MKKYLWIIIVIKLATLSAGALSEE